MKAFLSFDQPGQFEFAVHPDVAEAGGDVVLEVTTGGEGEEVGLDTGAV